MTHHSKAALAAVSAIAAAVMTGCTANMPEGYQAIKDAKTAYEQLNSARVIMTDLTADEQIMEFVFYINNDSEMVFSYYGKDGTDEQYAYSNGAEYFYKEPGSKAWTVIGSQDENYLYNLYNKEYRYPYARGGIFFFSGQAVESSNISDNEDGSCMIDYTYSADKLNSERSLQLEGVSSFASLSTTFCIDPSGYITEFIETGEVVNAEGETQQVNISISVQDMNEIFDIEYPVDVIAK